MRIKNLTVKGALALSLAGVAGLTQAGFLDELFTPAPQKAPVPLNQTTEQILKAGKVWLIDGPDTSEWSLAEGKKPRKGPAPILLKQDQGTSTPLKAEIDVGYIARNTEKVSLEGPIYISFEKDGSAVLKYGPTKTPVAVELVLRPYDVSGLPMAQFLKDRKGAASAESQKVGQALFPAGSVAYKVNLKFLNGEMVVPVDEHFTSARSSQELIDNFSNVPFCLKRVAGHAYGISFDPIKPKATEGSFQVVPVKSSSIFCQPSGEPAVAKGTWAAINTGNSHAVVLTLPKEVTAAELGIEPQDYGVSKFAFVAPAKGEKIFRPGRYYAKDTRLVSKRYFFNNTAAAAILGTK